MFLATHAGEHLQMTELVGRLVQLGRRHVENKKPDLGGIATTCFSLKAGLESAAPDRPYYTA